MVRKAWGCHRFSATPPAWQPTPHPANFPSARSGECGAASRFALERGPWLIGLELMLIALAFNFAWPFVFLQVIWAIGLGLALRQDRHGSCWVPFRLGRTVNEAIERGKHEQCQQCRRHDAADDDCGQRTLNFCTRANV
jgi:hypothetical protein